jgi:hypothetical protein
MHCCISMTTHSIIITLLTVTYTCQQYTYPMPKELVAFQLQWFQYWYVTHSLTILTEHIVAAVILQQEQSKGEVIELHLHVRLVAWTCHNVMLCVYYPSHWICGKDFSYFQKICVEQRQIPPPQICSSSLCLLFFNFYWKSIAG